MKHFLAITWRPLLMGGRMALAACGAILLCHWFRMPYSLYALVSAIFVTEITFPETWVQAVNRTIGNGFGALLGSLLCSLFGSGLLILCAAIITTTLLCVYIGLNAPSTKLSAFVAALIVIAHSDTPWLYGRDRFIETLLGIFMAVLVSLITPGSPVPTPVKETHE